MSCRVNAFCDFCDARCPDYIVDKKDWVYLCQHMNKWCSFEEVQGLCYLDAMNYIDGMPIWEPMNERVDKGD